MPNESLSFQNEKTRKLAFEVKMNKQMQHQNQRFQLALEQHNQYFMQGMKEVTTCTFNQYGERKDMFT